MNKVLMGLTSVAVLLLGVIAVIENNKIDARDEYVRTHCASADAPILIPLPAEYRIGTGPYSDFTFCRTIRLVTY